MRVSRFQKKLPFTRTAASWTVAACTPVCTDSVYRRRAVQSQRARVERKGSRPSLATETAGDRRTLDREQPCVSAPTSPPLISLSRRRAVSHSVSHSAAQSMGANPFCSRYSLALEKTLQPRNFVTERGDGCAASITLCRVREIILPFFCAKPPHRMKTVGVVLASSTRITASVKSCQPSLACELASPLRTVSVALNISTPCRAQPARWPCCGGLKPGQSSCSSL